MSMRASLSLCTCLGPCHGRQLVPSLPIQEMWPLLSSGRIGLCRACPGCSNTRPCQVKWQMPQHRERGLSAAAAHGLRSWAWRLCRATPRWAGTRWRRCRTRRSILRAASRRTSAWRASARCPRTRCASSPSSAWARPSTSRRAPPSGEGAPQAPPLFVCFCAHSLHAITTFCFPVA